VGTKWCLSQKYQHKKRTLAELQPTTISEFPDQLIIGAEEIMKPCKETLTAVSATNRVLIADRTVVHCFLGRFSLKLGRLVSKPRRPFLFQK
jgi:hypothetical protein